MALLRRVQAGSEADAEGRHGCQERRQRGEVRQQEAKQRQQGERTERRRREEKNERAMEARSQ